MKESVLRTLVPIIYALILKSGVGAWLGLDDAFLQSLAALAGAGLIYVGLRVAERYRPQIGWLLGYAAQPEYVKPHQAAAKRPVAKKSTTRRRKIRSVDGHADVFFVALVVSLMSALLIAPLVSAWAAVGLMVAALGFATGFHRMRIRLRN